MCAQTISSCVVVEGAGTDADRARIATAIVFKKSAIALIVTGRHLVERDGAIGASAKTVSGSVGVVVEDTGTDADRTSNTSAVVSKKGAIVVGTGGHLIEHDGAVGLSSQAKSGHVAVEGAGTDADRTGSATAVVLKKSTIALIVTGRQLVDRDGAVGASTQTISGRIGVEAEDTGTDADRACIATAVVFKKSAIVVRTGGHLVERDGAVGASFQTAAGRVAVEGTGTDDNRTRGATAVVFKKSAIALIVTSRHLVYCDGAFRCSLQPISRGVAVEGAGTDADCARANVVVLKISALSAMIETGCHRVECDGAAGGSIQAILCVAGESA